MSDSQKWSSLDDSEAPKRPSDVAEQALDVPITESNRGERHSGFVALMEPAALCNMRNRLMFGSLVGFVTGATFGGSTYSRNIKFYSVPLILMITCVFGVKSMYS